MAAYRKRDGDDAVSRDLLAYRRVTDRDLPTVQATARRLREAGANPRSKRTREGFQMRNLLNVKAHPVLAATAAVLVVAVVLGVVPVSWTRTTGHEVTLTLAAPAPTGPALGKVAGGLRAALHADGVRVALTTDGSGGTAATLTASVPSPRGGEVRRTADAFARELSRAGVAANAQVRALTERVSTNVYAYATGRAIELRVNSAGRSTAEIEADIRAQLAAAGLDNPQVQVTRDGDQTQVRIEAGGAADGQQTEFKVDLIGKDDQPLDASLHRFEVERKPGMTDADVRAEIERQMREAGVEGTVTVTDGKIDIRVEKRK